MFNQKPESDKLEISFAFHFLFDLSSSDIVSFSQSQGDKFIYPLYTLLGEEAKAADINLFKNLANIWSIIRENFVYLGFLNVKTFAEWVTACETVGIHF